MRLIRALRWALMIVVPLTESLCCGRSIAQPGSFAQPFSAPGMTPFPTMPALTSPHRRLECVDTGWNNSGENREVFYSNMGPGGHTFHIIAINGDSVSVDKAAELEIELEPSFYQTAWFRVLCAGAAMILVWLAYGIRIRQLSERAGITTAERERIARDLHDTLLQSVQSLLHRVQTISRRPMEEETRQMLVHAAALARDVVIEGRDKVHVLRSDETYPGCPVAALATLAEQLSTTYSAHFRCSVDGKPRALAGPAGYEFVYVLRESLTNAFAHAQASRIELQVTYGRSHLFASICDDGIGIDDEVLSNGHREGHWGLLGMRERVKNLHGKIDIDSMKGQYTKIFVTIPARYVYRRRGKTLG
jgi:signal transduction histidine kinase